MVGFGGIGDLGLEKEEILGGGYGERLDFWGEMGLKMEKEWIFFFVLFWGREREMGFVTIFVDGEDGWEDREKRGILVA